MFLIYFLVFTLMFTIFENVLLASISLLLVFVILLIYQFISKKEILGKKMIYSIVGSFFLAGVAFWIKEWRYYQSMDSLFQANDVKIQAQDIIIGNWTIGDISGQGKYIFSYKNDDYLLYSKKEYAIGDQIRIVWRMQENIQKDWFSYRKISPWTFAVPLFSGSFDFAKRMKMKGRKWTIYEDNSLPLRDEGQGQRNVEIVPSSMSQVSHTKIWFIKQMKKWIQEKVIKSYGENKVSGLILGMLIGDKSQIPESEYQSFIDSGLVHLIAVSGGNILMIVVFLQCILLFIPFYLRLGLIILTIIGYSLICWLDSSVFRAVLMGGMSMIALFRGREINIWRLLSMSCIIMLIINPYFLAYDTGFLLSYSALIGIVYFETQIRSQDPGPRSQENRIKKWLQYIYKSYITPSIWASIGIFPIIIFFMGKINILWIIGNLFVLPLVPFVMIYGFVSIWLYALFGWGRLLWIEEFLVNYIYKISELLSQYGIYLTVTWLRFKYVIFMIFLGFFIYRKTKSRDVGQGERNGKIKHQN